VFEVRDVELVRTTTDPDDHPSPARPEVAFVGRSNVGKSSLLNTLFRRRRLAHTSRTPGKTQTLNYYAVDDACYFVDLPGYGYAAVPRPLKNQWGPMMEAYLGNNPRLKGVVALIDSRHPPTKLDRQMIEWLARQGLPTLVVLTKADKVKRGDRARKARDATQALNLDAEQIAWFSSRTGEGRHQVLQAVAGLMKEDDRP
jgi:GTP-binding protein